MSLIRLIFNDNQFKKDWGGGYKLPSKKGYISSKVIFDLFFAFFRGGLKVMLKIRIGVRGAGYGARGAGKSNGSG
ncbi:MAG: hypothetical protein R6U29_10825 [Desulfosudaceae bacterium]